MEAVGNFKCVHAFNIYLPEIGNFISLGKKKKTMILNIYIYGQVKENFRY